VFFSTCDGILTVKLNALILSDCAVFVSNFVARRSFRFAKRGARRDTEVASATEMTSLSIRVSETELAVVRKFVGLYL
jgi:hypothetical protein